MKVIGAEIWRNNCAGSSCYMHFCLNQSVSLGMLSLKILLCVCETSSGLSNHAAVVGLQVVIILKHSKYNMQDYL